MLVKVKNIKWGRLVGEGANGRVYKCRYHGADVAVKELNSSMIRPESLNSFRQEFEHLVTLRHPNVVSFFGAAVSRPSHLIYTPDNDRVPLSRAYFSRAKFKMCRFVSFRFVNRGARRMLCSSR